MRLLLVAPASNTQTDYSVLAVRTGALSVTRVGAAAIVTVAALTPPDFAVSLCDEAIAPIDFDADVDVVGISANVSQAQRAIEIAGAFRARGKTVLIGGPHVSLAPALFEGHADCLVVGEFEPIAETVFLDMRRGALKPRYDGARADLSRSPVPRWDLYPNEYALGGVVQTSRGCPFECHFCDVIQYLGRLQRHKDDAQVIAEIQNLYDLGYNFVSLADDNFTVYRRRAKSLLKAIARWNGADGRDYVSFATQMSIDAARDDEMLALCGDAGLLYAFIGIESDNQASLAESKKRQNLGVDIDAQLRKIVGHGLMVEAALIAGFDHDDRSSFERLFDYGMALPAGAFKVSVLVAPVATPFYDLMMAQGRIVSDQIIAQFPSGNLRTNIVPAQMSRDELFVGAKWLTSKLYAPDNFYSRLEQISKILAPPPWVRRGGKRYWHPSRRRSSALYAAVLRAMASRDPALAQLISRVRVLMRARPEIRDGLDGMLCSYVITRRSYELAGVYDRDWATLDAPPFGTATADERLQRVLARA